MAEYKRTRDSERVVKSGGPYEAIVVSHLDKKYMGGLEVEILRYTGAGNTPERTGQMLTVRYLSPFYGVTPSKGAQPDEGYQHTQKSYGMWMVPPDVGTRVLVVFAEGNANMGYWIGCIQDDYMNFMVPDGRASTSLTADSTPEELTGAKLPVGEYNKKTESGDAVDPTLFRKPYNKDFTNILEIQGLIFDESRGTTTTSARRETPSSVFGVNTPGPLDKRLGSPRFQVGAAERKASMSYNRLGGSSFVMDDGDDKFIRASHAEDGPPIYINKERGETGGDETIPQNELIRLRTRTGHQILLHNSEDLIYIGNSRGTAWIELTSDGKIDIHAEDSISVMSNNDINFTAERDFNIDAGRNVNIRASARWSDGQNFFGRKESGRIQLESEFDTNVYAGKNYNLTAVSSGDIKIGHQLKTTVDDDYHLVTGASSHFSAKDDTHMYSGGNFFRDIGDNIHDTSGSSSYLKVGKNYNTVVAQDYKISVSGTKNELVETSLISTVNGPADLIYGNTLTKLVTGVENSTHHSTINTGVTGDVNLDVSNDIKYKSSGNYNVVSDSQIRLRASDDINQSTSSSFNAESSGSFNIQAGGTYGLDASQTRIQSGSSQGPSASADDADQPGATPTEALPAQTASPATRANRAIPVDELPRISLPYMPLGAQRPVPYDSILTRAPQHEPWGHHENTNPQAFKKEQTDREDPGMLPVSDRVLTPDTFTKGTSSVVSSRVVLGSNGSEFFTGTTGDGLVNQPQDTEYEFDPLGEEGDLAEIETSTGLTAQVAEVFKENFQGFIDDLEATGYEIKRIAGFARRQVVGNSSSWSLHASGAAIDINWPDQIYGGYPNGYFSPRPTNAPMTDMPDNTLELANKWGLGWGGAWRSLDDAMHFSAHKAEGGSYDFPRNGKIPKGPANEEVQPPKEEEPDETDQFELDSDEPQPTPGPQNSPIFEYDRETGEPVKPGPDGRAEPTDVPRDEDSENPIG